MFSYQKVDDCSLMLIEYAQFGATVDIPRTNGVISWPSEKNFPQGIRCQGEDRSCMTTECLQTISRLEWPGLRGVILRAGDDDVFGIDLCIVFEIFFVAAFLFRGNEQDRENPVSMAPKDAHTRASIKIPTASGSIVGGRKDKIA